GTLLNGHRRSSMTLRAGDQLTLGRDRFVVECGSATVVAERAEPELPTAESEAANEAEQRRSGHAIWWLLGAAALIGLVLVGILLRGT
ncbi:MAG: hypothetical protein ABIR16_06790, partial [Dokdonella sp.]